MHISAFRNIQLCSAIVWEHVVQGYLIPHKKPTQMLSSTSKPTKDCGDVKMLVKERRTVNFTHIQNFPSFLGHLKSRTSIKRFPILLSSIASSGKIVTISSFLMSQATGRLFPAQKTVFSTLSYVQLSRTKETLKCGHF